MSFRLPFLTLLLAAASLGMYYLTGDGGSQLQFERRAVATGEVWRVLTCQLTHFDANHLAWDVGALLVLGTLCETASRRRTAVTLGLAGATIPVVVACFQPQFEIYRGLSGIDSALFGLFASLLLELRRRGARIVGACALLGVLAKSAFEMSTGTTAFASGSGYAPVPLAHLAGVLCGAAAVFLTAPIFRRRESCSATPPPCRQFRSSPGPTPPVSC